MIQESWTDRGEYAVVRDCSFCGRRERDYGLLLDYDCPEARTLRLEMRIR